MVKFSFELLEDMMEFRILFVWFEISTVLDQHICCILNIESVVDPSTNIVLYLLVFRIAWKVVLCILFISIPFLLRGLLQDTLFKSVTIREISMLAVAIGIVFQDILSAFLLQLLDEIICNWFLCCKALPLDNFHDFLREIS